MNGWMKMEEKIEMKIMCAKLSSVESIKLCSLCNEHEKVLNVNSKSWLKNTIKMNSIEWMNFVEIKPWKSQKQRISITEIRLKLMISRAIVHFVFGQFFSLRGWHKMNLN